MEQVENFKVKNNNKQKINIHMTTKTKQTHKINNQKNRIRKQARVVIHLPVYREELLAHLDAIRDFQADEWYLDFPLPYSI